jgi:hypothetical protein
VRAKHGKRHGQPSPEFSLNARIPTLPNCVQEGEFNLAGTAFVKQHHLCKWEGWFGVAVTRWDAGDLVEHVGGLRMKNPDIEFDAGV